MAAHSIWNGSISFGLVTIPVSLRSAAREHALKFSLLDKRDLSPVGNLHINKRTRKEVAWKDVVKGYQYKKGKYVVLAPEDFGKANVKASQLLEIEDFVDMREVDPIYFDQPYYIVPTVQVEHAPTASCIRCCRAPRRSASAGSSCTPSSIWWRSFPWGRSCCWR